MKFGVNSWIWVSPLTTDEIARLAPLAASLGAEWFEVPLEDPAL
ncbi:MAG: sugar phosphate isomerase/epimerase, partial [Anaerolineae bacterium]|nr:sugar phosphate isomerase/epimerase [Anaerolineae bacterium]